MSVLSCNCWKRSPDYRTLTIYWFDRKSRIVGMTTKVQLTKGLIRHQRYDEFCTY